VNERILRIVAMVVVMLFLLVVVRLWLGERGWTAVVIVVVMVSQYWSEVTVE
jgi:hypothetical protein